MSKIIQFAIIVAIFAVVAIFAYNMLPIQNAALNISPSTLHSTTYANASIASQTNTSIGKLSQSASLSFLPQCGCGSEESCSGTVYCTGSCPSDCPMEHFSCISDGKLARGYMCSSRVPITSTASNSASNGASGASNSASNTASNSASSTSNGASNTASNTASGAATVITSTTSIPPGCGSLPNSIVQQIKSSAPWYCPINEQIYEQWNSDMPIAFAAILLAFAIAAIIFMVGAGLRNDRIRNFGIGELYEAIASAIIVGLFLYVSAVAFGIIPSLFVGTINPYATAFHLILSTIKEAEAVFSSLYNVFIMDSFYASINVAMDSPSIGMPPIALLNLLYALPLEALIIEPTYVLATFIIEGITALYAEYYLLVFFSVAAIPVFLVPGVIFRAIFPTRALGGMLIALAMGFYIIMPTMFAIAYYFTAPNILQTLSTASIQLNRFGSGSGAITNALTPDSPLVLQVSSTQSAMSSFWLLILFYPLLIIAVTYAFVTQIANFIGGASQMSGKMRTFI